MGVGRDAVGGTVGARIVAIIVDGGVVVIGFIVVGAAVAFIVGGGVAVIGFIVVGNNDCGTGDLVGGTVGTRESPLGVGEVVLELDDAMGAIVSAVGGSGAAAGDMVGTSKFVWDSVGEGVVELSDAVGSIVATGFVVSGADPVVMIIICSVLVHNSINKISCWLDTPPSFCNSIISSLVMFEIPLISIPGMDGHA
jgi:hypothetical protein